MNDITIDIMRTSTAFNDLPLPSYATSGSAGMDVYAAVEDQITIARGGIVLIPTALAIAVPVGFECQVRSRSGLALKRGVFCLNSPGTIDSDYRGEIGVILCNGGNEDVVVRRGDRVAQLVVARVERVRWNLRHALDDTSRGQGGFGSTGDA